MFRDELIQKLEEVALGMSKARTRVFEQNGLRAGQSRVLSALFEYGELSQADIGRIVDIAAPTVKKLVQNLISSGMVAVAESGRDKRINIVSLTDLGREQEAVVQKCRDELGSIATADFSEPEIIMTSILLARIDDNLKSTIDDSS